MGGKALNAVGLEALRMSPELYEAVWLEIKVAAALLASELGITDYRMERVRHIRAKASHGDMDILIDSKALYDALSQAQGIWAARVNGSGVNSFAYTVEGGVVQVDLIYADPEEYEVASDYFAWGDCSNLIGRVAHALGFKWGHDGLWYKILDERNPDNVLRTVLVTRSTEEAFEILDYSYRRHCVGFETPEDVYKFIESSCYFQPKFFLFENRNAKGRTRDTKRPMYMEFLEFCQTLQDHSYYDYDLGGTRDAVLAYALASSPEFKARMDFHTAELEDAEAAKPLFNGRRVAELTGLTDKPLGEFMGFIVDLMGSKPIVYAAVRKMATQVAVDSWVHRLFLVFQQRSVS